MKSKSHEVISGYNFGELLGDEALDSGRSFTIQVLMFAIISCMESTYWATRGLAA